MLEFWATWCAPCRASLPALAEFATWAGDSAADVAVVLVNTEEPESDPGRLRSRVRHYLDRLGVRLPCWIDSAATTHRALGSGLPMTLLVEPSGRVLELHSGFKVGLADTLRRHVRARLSAPR